MLYSFLNRLFLLSLAVLLIVAANCLPTQAAGIDLYVKRYLRVREPIALELNAQGIQKKFSPLELSDGKRYFEDSCINCHVGGSTLPNPLESLALDTLKGANPPRDNINALVSYMRQPMTYDGSEETFWCREITPNILSQQQIENLAAFVLTAAKKAPGWGTDSFGLGG
ncbi:MAG: photosystem II cytochrome PsbV2 [Richelia sp. RM2_1_2]|nr:photosystem II cytochrome PsbV2 [Richelia sp. SM1_7_0]NJN06928.1 photosystem II cytochrome PsbV2 [Richelia sp. RM1_1_1]NJO26205.1 photosystem II cytochrome PsbV2 [Richelia sp. SL_2_1]NJO58099.1 photosystem II cytochrome PsbV2 [Richelia sp. RM2_1_2]NJS16393.1 photosystem II cytochrome PsbV2 [Nostocaceae cyanobacterium CSU_2_110]